MAAITKISAFKTPKEETEGMMAAGIAKAKLSWDKTVVLGFLAGVYVAFGGSLAIMVAGGYDTSVVGAQKGVQKFLFGAVFPTGLVLVIIAGAELFTGNLAMIIPGVASKKISYRDWMKNWFWSCIGNFIGSVFVAYFLIYLPDMFVQEPWNSFAKTIALRKIELGWGKTILRAVGCNWLVCLAVWIASSAQDIAGKILAIWFPIMAFATLGFEHVVANMFFVPLGLMYGTEKTFWDYLGRSFVPSAIGNAIGGSLLVGALYFYIYILDEYAAEEKKKEDEKKDAELTAVVPAPAAAAPSIPIAGAPVAVVPAPVAVVEEKKPIVDEKKAPAS